ncbi:MAG: nitroreductase family protein [Pseudomonadota bacterium]
MIKKANTDHPVHEIIQHRWSPYRFSDRSITSQDLHALFEAARWAPSSYNEQPWRYIMASKDQPEEFNTIIACLEESNQVWAKNASALVLGFARTTFERNGKLNKAAFHDLGAAASYMSFEATSRGIAIHQIIGLLPEVVKEKYEFPKEFEVLTALAIGYADLSPGDDGVHSERDNTARSRKKISDFVFHKTWGSAMVAL